MSKGIKNQEMDFIPEGWKIISIGESGQILSGGTPDTKDSDYWNGSIDWCTPTDITALDGYKFISDTARKITKEGLANSSATLLPINSLVICTRATIGDCAINLQPICTNQGFKSIIPNEDVDVNFLYYVINLLKPTLIKLSSGSTFLEISKKAFESIKVSMPPLPEQQKIAEILSTVDEKIDVIEAQIIKTTELKKGLMQQLLTKGIGHTQFKQSPLGEIPENWEVIKIEDLLNDKRMLSHLDGNHGGLYPKASEFVDEGIPYVSANSFKNGKVDFSLCKRLSPERAKQFKKGVAKNGDVLFAHNATVGPVAFLETDLDYVILSTTATYYRLDNITIDSRYWLYFLTSFYFVDQYSKVMGQSTRNQVPITMQRSFLSILPPVKEQVAIGRILYNVDEKLEVLQLKKEAYQKMKKGLMQQLLTGKIRVNSLIEKEAIA